MTPPPPHTHTHTHAHTYEHFALKGDVLYRYHRFFIVKLCFTPKHKNKEFFFADVTKINKHCFKLRTKRYIKASCAKIIKNLLRIF